MYQGRVTHIIKIIRIIVVVVFLISCTPAAQPTTAPQATSPQTIEATSETVQETAAPVMTSEPESTEQPQEVVIYAAAQDDLINLDPTQTTQAGDRTLAQNIFSGLVKFDPGTTDVIPDLAETWEISPNGLVYTFQLRSGVKFHGDYGELTANDVKFSFERHFDEAVGSKNASDLAVIDRIDVPDPLTVEITLKESTPGFLVRLAWQSAFVVSEKAVSEKGQDFGFQPIGTGPYAFSSWTPGQETVLVANDNYYAGRPKIDKLVFRIVKDENVGLLAFQQKEVDAVAIKQFGSFQKVGDIADANIVQGSSACIYLVYINNTIEPFNDVRVRQALNYALDKEQVAQTVNGMIKISPSVVSPILFGYTSDVQKYEYNPEKAQELLAEAGFPTDFKITINYTKSYLYEELALLLKDALSKIGLNAEAIPVERAIVSQIRSEKTYHLLPGTITRFDTDQYLSSFFTTGAGSNYPGYSNERVDELIKQARAEQDTERRKELYAEAQKLIAEDMPVIPVGTCDSIFVARPDIQGLYAHPYEALMDFTYAWVETP